MGKITAKAKFSGDVNYNDIPDLEAVLTIVQSDGAWQIASLFPYMNDNVKYNITNKIDYQNYRANEVVAIDNKILIDKEKISSFQLLYSQTFFDFYRVFLKT